MSSSEHGRYCILLVMHVCVSRPTLTVCVKCDLDMAAFFIEPPLFVVTVVVVSSSLFLRFTMLVPAPEQWATISMPSFFENHFRNKIEKKFSNKCIELNSKEILENSMLLKLANCHQLSEHEWSRLPGHVLVGIELHTYKFITGFSDSIKLWNVKWAAKQLKRQIQKTTRTREKIVSISKWEILLIFVKPTQRSHKFHVC